MNIKYIFYFYILIWTAVSYILIIELFLLECYGTSLVFGHEYFVCQFKLG